MASNKEDTKGITQDYYSGYHLTAGKYKLLWQRSIWSDSTHEGPRIRTVSTKLSLWKIKTRVLQKEQR